MTVVSVLHPADACIEFGKENVDIVVRDVCVDCLLVIFDIFLQIVHQGLSARVVVLDWHVH